MNIKEEIHRKYFTPVERLEEAEEKRLESLYVPMPEEESIFDCMIKPFSWIFKGITSTNSEEIGVACVLAIASIVIAIINILLVVILWAVLVASLKIINIVNVGKQMNAYKHYEEEKRLSDERIRKARNEAGQREKNEYDYYRTKVNNIADGIMNRGTIKELVEYSALMFDRAIQKADSRPHIPQINASMSYHVHTNGISFFDEVGNHNEKDDIIFIVGCTINGVTKRYPDLNSREECEGMAKAIAKSLKAEMKQRPQKNKAPYVSADIKIEHEDSYVTMRYRVNNLNFVPVQQIT